MKFGWIDLRAVPQEHRESIVDATIHARLDGVLDDKPDMLTTLPPTVRRVYLPVDGEQPPTAATDLVLRLLTTAEELDAYRLRLAHVEGVGAAVVDVVDDPSLQLACAAARTLPYTLVKFRDPTKIPLEIVIAAADKSPGQLVCAAADLEEAFIILDVLEKGSEGVLLAPKDANDVFRFAQLLRTETPNLGLDKLTVESIEHNGLGDRVCVDTCTNLRKDEGILVGAYAHGFILCVSETHPLPYMPTRPFRVNAGALHSSVMGLDNRTNYLSELQTGSPILAVGAEGKTRRVIVGRTKLESRPLLTIRAVSDEGVQVSLTPPGRLACAGARPWRLGAQRHGAETGRPAPRIRRDRPSPCRLGGRRVLHREVTFGSQRTTREMRWLWATRRVTGGAAPC